MTRFVLITICFLVYSPIANACDYELPEIKTSEYISDKTIFWGRATAKKWEPQAKIGGGTGFPTSIYADVEVIRPLKGTISKKSKIWLSQSSCGIYVPLGQVILFVVKPIGESDYYADQLTSSLASDQAIISLLKLDIDVKVGGGSYPPTLETLEYEYWKKWLSACESSTNTSKPDNCLSRPVLKKIAEAYDTEFEHVENIAMTEKKSWWPRFKK